MMGRRLMCLVLLLAATPTLGEDKYNVNVRMGWAGFFRPDRWTPVTVSVQSNRSTPLDGSFELRVRQDSLTEGTVRQPFVLTPGLVKHMTLVTPIAREADLVRVKMRDAGGRELWSYETAVVSPSGSGQLKAMGPDDMLVALVGHRPSELAQLGRAYYAVDPQPGALHIANEFEAYLPWEWTGYDGLDLLILLDPKWQDIRPGQARAIADWVRQGGRLMLVLGSNGPPPAGPLADVIPFTFEEPREVSLPNDRQSPWAGDKPVTLYSLVRKDGAAVLSMDEDGLGANARAIAKAGFGTVLVQGWRPLATRANRVSQAQRVWAEQIGEVLNIGPDGASLVQGQYESDGYYGYGAESELPEKAVNQIMEYLLDVPQLRPMDIGWVVGLVAMLALLLGPVDYFVLKKLDRQPWTWVTSAVIIGVFTVGAYYGVRAIRAGALQLRVVSVTDVAPDGDCWSTQYVGLFAPATDTYEIEGMAENSWWTSTAPISEYYYYGGPGYYGNESIAMRHVQFVQNGDGSLPEVLPVNIWSMQCLRGLGRTTAPDVSVTLEDGVLEITNRTEFPLSDIVAVPGRGTSMGASTGGGVPTQIAPGESERVALGDLPRRAGEAPFQNQGTYYAGVGAGWSAMNAVGTVERSAGMIGHRDHGATIVVMRLNAPSPAVSVAGYASEVNNVQMLRFVVYPQ